jgi:hypothetical protein
MDRHWQQVFFVVVAVSVRSFYSPVFLSSIVNTKAALVFSLIVVIMIGQSETSYTRNIDDSLKKCQM